MSLTGLRRGAARPIQDVLADGVEMNRRDFRRLLIGLVSVMLLSALDHTIVVTALPVITDDLAGAQYLTLVVTGYMLANALSALWFGQLADLIGPRRALFLAIIIFTVGSALCGLAQNMPQLVVLRIVQGIGAGGLMTLSQSVIAGVVRPRERGRYQGIVMSAFAGASIAGPLLGGSIADHLSWRAIFLVNVPFGIIALGLVTKSLRHQFPTRARADSRVGTALLSLTAVLFLLGVSQAGSSDLPAWGPGGSIALSLVFLAGFIFSERLRPRPLFASRALRSKTFVVANAANVGGHIAMMGTVVLLPVYLHDVRGYGAAATGLLLLPQVFGWLSATMLAGYLISWTGRVRLVCLIGTSIMTVGLLGLGSSTAATPLGLLFACLAVFGIGQGFALQALVVAAQAEVAPTEMGKVTGFSSFTRSIGSVMGVALSGALLNALTSGGSSLERAFQITIWAAAPVAFFAFVVCCFMPPITLGRDEPGVERLDPEPSSVSAGGLVH